MRASPSRAHVVGKLPPTQVIHGFILPKLKPYNHNNSFIISSSLKFSFETLKLNMHEFRSVGEDYKSTLPQELSKELVRSEGVDVQKLKGTAAKGRV